MIFYMSKSHLFQYRGPVSEMVLLVLAECTILTLGISYKVDFVSYLIHREKSSIITKCSLVYFTCLVSIRL